MISMPSSLRSAIPAIPSRRFSSYSRKQRKAPGLCALLFALLCGAASFASAQTAHFSGSTPMNWVQSSLEIPGPSSPNGIAADGSGNIYVASFGQAVVKFTPSGTSGSITAIGTSLGEVAAVAVDGNGNVYIGDVLNHQVVKETPSGASYIQSTVASSSVGSTFYPNGIAVDGSGNIYIEDQTNKQVLKETLSGSTYLQSTVVSGLPYGISSIAADASGNVYFTDDFDHAAVKETLVSGNYQQSLVGNTGGYCIPTSVAVDTNGNLFIAGKNQILVGSNTTYSGVAFVETPLGNTYVQSAISIGQTIPTGIAVNGSGNLYISSSGEMLLEESPVYGNFGTVNLGSLSPPTIAMIFTFDTAGTLGRTAVLTQGATGLDFSDAGSDTCTANTAYAAGATCTLNVTFTPKFAGTRNGTSVLYNSAGSAIATGNLQGLGFGPQLRFLPGAQSLVTGSIGEPEGVTIDNSGNVYVTNANAIYEIHAVNGSIPASPTITTPLATGGRYYSVAVDTSGNLYTAPYPGNSVIEIEAVDGVIPASPTITTLASSFNEPEGVAVDSNGNVYVADSFNNAIKEILAVNGSIPASPTIVTLATADCVLRSVAVDSIGNVYFDGCGDTLMQIEAINGAIPTSPTIRTLATNIPVGGIAVDGSGNVYVSNSFNGPVQEILAVNGSIPPSPTIVAVSESIAGGEGVTVDASGNLYIANVTNNLLEKLNFAAPPSLTFANTAFGTISADSPQDVTITNIGNAALIFPTPSSGSNPSIPLNFTLNESGASACPVVSAGSSGPGSLAAGASCQLFVNFAPTTEGLLTGSLVLTDNNLNAASPTYTSQSIGLSGTGTFGLTASPAALTVAQGGSSTSTITVAGISGSVNLASSLYIGMTAAFSPNPTTGTSVLTLSANNSVAPGIYSLTIVATSGTQTVSTPIVLTVVAGPSFTLSASAQSLSVAQGSSATSTIAVTGANGFSGSVNLAASDLPYSVTATFNPNPTAGTALLTLNVGAGAQLGAQNITITGTSGGLTASTTLSFTVASPQVAAPAPTNFGAVNIGTPSSAIPLTFVFLNGGTLDSTAVFTQGATGLDFTDAGTGTCAPHTSFTPGQSCTVNVVFTPALSGTRDGAVVVNDNFGNVLATGYIQGTGLGPQVNFLPGTESIVANASSGLGNPYADAVDGQGNVYIADVNNNLVWKATPSAGGYTLSTIPTSGLNYPSGVAVDGSGNIYIADNSNNRILEETPSVNGYSETDVADANNGIFYPVAITIDGSGNIYFIASGIVYEESPSAGSFIQTTIPTPGLNTPQGIAVDASGNLYITDITDLLVYKETLTNGAYTQTTIPMSGLIAPAGIAVDGGGNVYVADISANAIYKETLTGASYVQSTVSSSQLNSPIAVAIDGSGNVYIVDNSNARVVKEDLADAPSLSFATTAYGSTSTDSPQTITVENIGNAPLILPVPSAGNNPTIATNFTLSSGATACTLVAAGSSAGTLPAGASCQFPISFTPTAAGSLSGSLVLTDNNLNAAAPTYASQTIALSGTATQVTPTINWATPAAITYGTLLSATQLNASSTVAGSFAYSPAAGTVLTAGQQTLTVTFTPTNTTAYTTATATVTLTVNQVTPAITWTTPKAITYGTPLTASQLNASSTVAGTFTYSPAAGTTLSAGAQTLTVTFTPTDTTDYTTATDSVPLTVSKATLIVTWATPATIPYGTALSATQLDATSNAAGTFSYSPAAGTVLAVGNHILTVTFTPSTPADYTTATATHSVTLTVNKATPAITWAAPVPITYGTVLSATQLDANSTVAGTFSYSPAAGTLLAVGNHTLTATFTPANSADYTTTTANVTLTVDKATPAITWATPKAIIYGTALSATQLDATSTVAGSFTYSSKSGAVLGAGSQTLTATFTPTNAADYTTATASVTLTVNKATPAITWATPKAITYGTALSATQLDATSKAVGTFTYSPAAGTVLAVGNQKLTATFTPTDTTDYTTATASVTLTVNR